ncbi:glycosyltransferase family 9 protein [Dyadobacter sandarakinus]|uniref:ADP-heptose--LPS heptosyltransferase n=1 Tax=Dyadobacter sandarakinus TaxID=2747268 RepID=A0ABX7I2H1_9BACT|nr:glycosyltransferase family 9 protein [Dyadobacter sandarakinus]QRR00286.1 ADP-heptose--LPS heptosyltransferase [Dyadobacter sandarakinus]
MPESTNSGANWLDYILTGDFEAVWKLKDEEIAGRGGVPDWHLPRHFQHIWDGSSLAGKRVLVRCYHGLGDTVQFIRYMPLLKAVAAEVIVWAQAGLLPLLQTVRGIDKLLPLHDGAPDVAYDADVEIMELPHIFRTTLETIPAQVPYLHVQPSALPDPSSLFSVGLVWRAGDWDDRRSIAFSQLAELLAIPGVQFYIMQENPEKAGWKEGSGLFAGPLSLPDYARMMKSMQLVISVDSMPAHLAGALGVPVWTLLHADADWRWMRDRDDSPWYPTMKLFRQESAGDWGPVIKQVGTELSGIIRPSAAHTAF